MKNIPIFHDDQQEIIDGSLLVKSLLQVDFLISQHGVSNQQQS